LTCGEFAPISNCCWSVHCRRRCQPSKSQHSKLEFERVVKLEVERGPGDEGLCGGGSDKDQGVARGECGGKEGCDLFGKKGCGSFKHQINPDGETKLQ